MNTILRSFCPKCGIKHLGKAYLLTLELHKGYAEHYWLALANMTEAEDEILSELPELANEIRGERKLWEEDSSYRVDFFKLQHKIADAVKIQPDLSSWKGKEDAR